MARVVRAVCLVYSRRGCNNRCPRASGCNFARCGCSSISSSSSWYLRATAQCTTDARKRVFTCLTATRSANVTYTSILVVAVLAKAKTTFCCGNTSTPVNIRFAVHADKLFYYWLWSNINTTNGIVLARLCVKNSYTSPENVNVLLFKFLKQLDFCGDVTSGIKLFEISAAPIRFQFLEKYV